MPVTDLGDTDGWTVEPVDFDPFASVPDSSVTRNPNRDFGYQGFAGHVAASPAPDQAYTPKYLAARPQGAMSSYDPSWSEKIQQGVSEAGQGLGMTPTGAERMGYALRTGAEMAPGSGNILQANEAYRAGAAGDPWGAALHGAMALPIPGATAEEGVTRRLSPLGFYSHGADVAANLPQRVGTTQQMVAALTKAGVKPVEMEASGVKNLAEAVPLPLFSDRVRAEDLEAMFHQASPPLQETVLRPPPPQIRAEAWSRMSPEQQIAYRERTEESPSKFSDYTLPSGQNYREVLMHLPDREGERPRIKDPDYYYDPEGRGLYEMPSLRAAADPSQQNFKSAHWDQPNIVAHLRLNDRIGENGENLLHMEELQSDWGQKAREIGVGGKYGVPEAPYIGSTQGWTDLGLKRALIEAAQGGYSHLSWTPGADQAARYDLSKKVSNLHYYPGIQTLKAFDRYNEPILNRSGVEPEHLPDIVGKAVAEKLLSQPKMRGQSLDGDDYTYQALKGPDLSVGGEGMRAYYDRMVPNQLSKIAKKLDPNAKIGTTRIDTENAPMPPGYGDFNTVVPSMEITPLMRQRILKGLPQYQRGGRVGFQEGGELDDDSVALGATGEPNAKGIPAAAGRGSPIEGDWPGQGSSGRVGPGYPAGPPEGQPGSDPGRTGSVGLRPDTGGTQDFATAHPDVFHQAISAGKAASPHGSAVTLHSPEEYAQMRPFLSSDGRSGFALDGDNIVSVFRHPEAERGTVQRALPIAVAEGGRRLDAYDPILPKLYAGAGFKAVARLPFNPQFQPEDWDAERHGQPDVVFMVHDPDPANASHVGGKPVATYDEGVAAQDEALKEIGNRPLMAPEAVDRPATSLMGSEEHLLRQREGLEPPGEWTGGRISFAHGGMLEPVDHDPFPPAPAVQPSDVRRAKGYPEPVSDMHRRIAAASQDEHPS